MENQLGPQSISQIMVAVIMCYIHSHSAPIVTHIQLYNFQMNWHDSQSLIIARPAAFKTSVLTCFTKYNVRYTIR